MLAVLLAACAVVVGRQPKHFRLLGAGCDTAVTVELGAGASEGTRRFQLPGGHVVGVRETTFGEGKLGASLWSSGIALATWLCADPSRTLGKSVLELGSGIGLSGLACASIGARSVSLSDMERLVPDDFESPTGLLQSLRLSADDNGLAQCVTVRRIDWREYVVDGRVAALQQTAADRGDELFDVVIASDCVYYPGLLEPLAATLRHFLAPGGTAYMMSGHRKALGASWVEEPHASPFEFAKVLRTAVWCEVDERLCTCVTPYSEEAQVLHEIRWRAVALAALVS
jgi:predicted nicotinamide N-methyase